MAYEAAPAFTFDQIHGELPGDEVPGDVDLSVFSNFAKEVLENMGNGKETLTEGALWRDYFALTGRLRTFNRSEQISAEWASCTAEQTLKGWKIDEARVLRPTRTSSWIDVSFKFSIHPKGGAGLARTCFGIVSFVPDAAREWKVWMLRTMLENFENYASPDDPSNIFTNPPTKENHSSKFEVIIIGAGQCGLSLAGRLGALGIKYMLLEKEKEIGYSWIGKYDSVRQHTVKEMNNLPFDRTYKPDDPILLPAKTVTEGFKVYVEKYNINYCLDAQTEKCSRNDDGWEMNVRVGNEVRVLQTKHLVLAMGGGSSVPTPPEIPGKEDFTGDVLDMRHYKNCKSWSGKKGIVVGAATTAHDVAQDMLDAGLKQVTMIQRGKTPVWPVEWIVHGQSILYNAEIPSAIADRLLLLLPVKIDREIMKENLGGLVAINAARFDAVEKSGFRVDRDAVLMDCLLLRGGGYYIDVGTSKRIADGDIKVKSGVKIERFTERGLAFEDGEEIDADLIVLATGYERDVRRQAATIIGHEIAGSLPQSRVLNAEGEYSWGMIPRAERLWVLHGSVNDARFHSRFIALQIQAESLGQPLPECQWRAAPRNGKTESGS